MTSKAHKSCTRCRERTRGGCGHPALTHALIGQPTPNPRNNGRECPCFEGVAAPLTGFKVVRVEDGKYYSAAGGKGLNGTVEYLRKKWVEPTPGCGPLAVFVCKDDALTYTCWYALRCRFQVFRCLYRPSTQKTMWTGRGCPSRIVHLPPGTALATSVCLMERVDP